MHRLFVALRPPAAVRTALEDVMHGVDGARWQDDAQLHMTLRFIGEVSSHRADDVAAALGAVVTPAPTISIDGVGAFARRGRTQTLYARVSPDEGLSRLQAKVETAAVRAGCAPEGRRFFPHVTLARFGRIGADEAALARWAAEHAALRPSPFVASHFVLYESRLGRSGATYDVVERRPLRP